MNYTEADAKLQGRCKDSRKLGNNTYLQRREDGKIAMHYHNTDVVIFYPDGTIELDSGGWITSTTKERMNWALGHIGDKFAHLYQESRRWFLTFGTNGEQRQSFPYADHMKIMPDGSVVGAGKETPRADAKIKKRVREYAKLCASRLPLPHPDGGDCWDCCMVISDSTNKENIGKTMGDVRHSNHLDSHMKECYVVPSLVANALKEHYNAPAAFWEAFDEKYSGMGGDRSFGKMAVERAVYKYILKRKGFAV